MQRLLSYDRENGVLSKIEEQVDLWKAATGNSKAAASYGIGGFEGIRKHPQVRQAQAEVLNSMQVYPQGQGEAWLGSAIAWSHEQDSGGRVKLDPSETSVSWGARGALMVIMETLAQVFGRGAKVILTDPGYGGTIIAIKRAGLIPILVQCGLGRNYCEGALRKIAEIRKAGEVLAAVIWEPVHNPSGTLGTAEECLLLGNATHQAEALFIGDEVYRPFVFEGKECPCVLELFDFHRAPVVAIRSGSKVHANSQDRIGDIAGTPPVIARYRKAQSDINYGPPPVCQYGYQVALLHCRRAVPAIVRLVAYRGATLYQGFRETGWDVGRRPSAGMFGLVPPPDGFPSGLEFCLTAARQVGLRFWPLEAFCRPESSPELIEKAKKLLRLPFVETRVGMQRTFAALLQLGNRKTEAHT